MDRLKRKGISLIVLIITIIVVIILAAVVILTISKNNPVDSSREAKFKEDIRTFQDDLLLSISKDYTANAGQRDYKFNATSYDKIKEYIPSFTKEYEGKIAIYEDDIVYKLGKISKIEEEWINNIGIKKK